jgi:hypothetical protein
VSLEDKVLFMAETLKKEVLEGSHQTKENSHIKETIQKVCSGFWGKGGDGFTSVCGNQQQQ